MNILVVDDRPDHAQLTQLALEVSGANPLKVHHVDCGIKCIAFLRKQPPFEVADSPDLVLLDLNMPMMNGFEVLAHIGKDEQLSSVPVVVLSTSQEPSDVRQAYLLGCNSYIAKPVEFERLVGLMGEMVRYWSSIAILPSRVNEFSSLRRTRPFEQPPEFPPDARFT